MGKFFLLVAAILIGLAEIWKFALICMNQTEILL